MKKGVLRVTIKSDKKPTEKEKKKRTVNRVMIDPKKDDFYNHAYDVLDSVSLTCFDPLKNQNKFYVAEIHHSKIDPKPYRFYVHHGRVGAKGQAKSEPFMDLDLAKKKYNLKVREKNRTGYIENDVALQSVGSQNAKEILKTDSLGDLAKDIVPSTPSTLDTNVQTLVEHLYAEANQALAVSVTGSTKGNIQSPIGNLGVQGIKRGRELISMLAKELKTGDIAKIEELSIEYYKTIPRKMPSNLRKDTSWILNSQERLSKEVDTLDLYEDALRLLPQLGQKDIDSRYNALDCTIRYIDPTEHTMEYLRKKIANSHASNHNFKLRIKNAFEVYLKNAPEFDSSCGNVRNLFHGSRSANLVGILSSYLKLPNTLSSDIHKTGAMFGAGIYFASDCTKSANYSFASFSGRRNKYPTAFLMVAEVALGNQYKTQRGYPNNQPPQGYNSVMGEKGVSLINNEYIVYDPTQVRVRYLLEVEKY